MQALNRQRLYGQLLIQLLNTAYISGYCRQRPTVTLYNRGVMKGMPQIPHIIEGNKRYTYSYPQIPHIIEGNKKAPEWMPL